MKNESFDFDRLGLEIEADAIGELAEAERADTEAELDCTIAAMNVHAATDLSEMRLRTLDLLCANADSVAAFVRAQQASKAAKALGL